MASRRTQLIAAGAAVVVAIGIAFAIVLPRLGRSGGSGRPVSLTVEASTPAGAPPSGADLDRTRHLLVARMAAAGLEQPKVDRSGDRRLVLHAKAKAGAEPLGDLIAAGQLRIRRVLATSDANAASTPAAPTGQPTAQPTGQPTGQPTEQPGDPSESGQPDELASAPRAAVAAKLGPAYTAADQITSFDQGQALAPNVLQAFAALTPAEVAVLPEQMQLYVPSVSCDTLHNRPADAITQPDTEIVTCSGDGQKYLLDDAEVTGRDILSAKAGNDANNPGLW